MKRVVIRKINGGYIIEWYNIYSGIGLMDESYFPNLSSVLIWLSSYYDEPCGIYDPSQAKSEEGGG